MSQITTEQLTAAFHEGYNAYDPTKNAEVENPYKGIIDRGYQAVVWHQVLTYQPEATMFYNGWQLAKKEKEKIEGYSLFLDDFRFPSWVTWVHIPQGDNWIVARHYYDFKGVIETHGLPRFISFDFDLDRHGLPIQHLEYKTGFDCVNWLINHLENNNLKFPRCAIHSANPEGSKKIYERIIKYLEEKQNART